MMGRVYIVLALFTGLALSAKHPADSAFVKGNEAYRSGEYAQALEFYQQAYAQDSMHPQINYNLANAAYKMGWLPTAILHYERALKFAPGMEDALHNLQLAEEQLIDQIKVSPLQRWSDRWHQFLTGIGAQLFSWIAIALLVAGWLMLYLRLSGKWLSASLSGSLATLFLAGFMAFAFFGYSAGRLVREYPFAIIMAPKVDVLVEPREEAITAFILHEGTRVEIRQRSGDWWEIRLPDGKVGWISAKQAEQI